MQALRYCRKFLVDALSEIKSGVNLNAFSAIDIPPKEKWAGLDSNQRKLTLTGLQPVPFSLSGTDPFHIYICSVD